MIAVIFDISGHFHIWTYLPEHCSESRLKAIRVPFGLKWVLLRSGPWATSVSVKWHKLIEDVMCIHEANCYRRCSDHPISLIRFGHSTCMAFYSFRNGFEQILSPLESCPLWPARYIVEFSPQSQSCFAFYAVENCFQKPISGIQKGLFGTTIAQPIRSRD